MLGQSFTAAIEARVQGRVARFLAMKPILVRLSNSLNVNVRKRAVELSMRQRALEESLKRTLLIIEKIKKGSYTFVELGKVSAFATAMQSHIQAVERLASGAPAQAFGGVGWATIAMGAAGVVGVALIVRRRYA